MRTSRVFTAGAVLALTLSGCTSGGAAPAGTPSNAAAGTSSAAAPEPEATGSAAAEESYDQILAGERQALIHIAEDDKDWSATYEGPITIGSGTDDGSRFRLLPADADGQFMIEALRAREEGGRWCVMADERDEPVSLGTVKCAEGETTLFKVTATGEQDDKGRPTHLITHEKFGTVQVRNDGSALYIQEVGDGGSRGTFSFVDRGAVEEK